MMEKTDSVKLVQHIEDAENWLKKAKDEYNQENPIRGELILNLAQAEVKHAWELSHHQYVSDEKKPETKRKSKFFIPAAASVLVILAITLFMQFGKAPLHSPPISRLAKPSFEVNKSLAKASSAPQKTGAKQMIKEQVPRIQPEPSQDPELIAMEEDVSVNPVAQNEPDTVNQDVISYVETKAASTPKTAEVQEEIHERQPVQSQTNLKPVSQLSIDEETLVKEASRSLRNGK